MPYKILLHTGILTYMYSKRYHVIIMIMSVTAAWEGWTTFSCGLIVVIVTKKMKMDNDLMENDFVCLTFDSLTTNNFKCNKLCKTYISIFISIFVLVAAKYFICFLRNFGQKASKTCFKRFVNQFKIRDYI